MGDIKRKKKKVKTQKRHKENFWETVLHSRKITEMLTVKSH